MVPWRGYTGSERPYLVSTPVAFADSVASYRATCCQESTCERSQIMSLAVQNLLSEARFTDSPIHAVVTPLPVYHEISTRNCGQASLISWPSQA
jgi:hypothetical protein